VLVLPWYPIPACSWAEPFREAIRAARATRAKNRRRGRLTFISERLRVSNGVLLGILHITVKVRKVIGIRKGGEIIVNERCK